MTAAQRSRDYALLMKSDDVFRGSRRLTAAGVPMRAANRLADFGVFLVADLARLSAEQVLSIPGIGKLTVERLRRQLLSAGLDFATSRDPIRRAREIHERKNSVGTGITDRSHIGELRIHWRVVRQCVELGLTSVGQLRGLTSKQAESMIGARSTQQLASALRLVGLTFVSLRTPDARVQQRSEARTQRRASPL